jgi:hypothetical protein
MQDKKYLFKKAVWRKISPLFPFWRRKLGFLRILRYSGRENFLIGNLKDGWKLEEVENELVNLGFEKYYVAWIDIGEVLGMRKNQGFEYQYHIRIFDDGEVRGHFELTPEYSTFKHFFDFGKEERNEEFKKMLYNILK